MLATGFEKQSTGRALHSYNTAGLIMDSFKKMITIDTTEPLLLLIIPCILHFQNLVSTLPIMQLCH